MSLKISTVEQGIVILVILFFGVNEQIVLGQQPVIYNTRISIGYDGSQANGDSYYPTISNNGRFVVFASDATNLVPNDTNNKTDVFVFDLETEIMERVSEASNGEEGNEASGFDNLAGVSNDGRYVVFVSEATNLVENDTNISCQDWETQETINCPDVFIKDRLTNEIRLVSVSSDGVLGNDYSGIPSISADGRYVAFFSVANNLVEDDTNEVSDIFTHDMQTGETKRVSIAGDGTQPNRQSVINRISANGRYVVFETFADNLSSEDVDDQLDVYMHDMQTGETLYLSGGFSDGVYHRYALMADVSADGRYVSFLSDLRDGHEGDAQIYRFDRQTALTEIVSTAGENIGNKGSDWSSISDDGRWVAFTSKANNLVDIGGNICDDCENIYLKDMATDKISLLTQNIAGDYSYGNKSSVIPSISGDGIRVAFDSTSEDLILGDTNNRRDIFVYGWKTIPVYSVNLPVVFK